MKKFLILLSAIIAVAMVPKAASAQPFDFSSSATNAESKARVAIGKLTMINTQNVQLIPRAQIYLLQDLKNPHIFYVAISLDDSLYKEIVEKGDKIFYAQALEIDKPQTEIILRDYRAKLDAELASMKKTIDELKTRPASEKRSDKKARLILLNQKIIERNSLKAEKETLISEFRKLIADQSSSTRLYRIFHSELDRNLALRY